MNEDKPEDVLRWDVQEVAKALKISEKDVQEYFTDGRRVSFILERRIAKEVLKGELPESEGTDFDIFDEYGKKWEVRCISKGGIYFCPSYMVGSGRHFEEKGFLDKLSEIEGYVIADIESFPNIPFWFVKSQEVLKWWKSKKLGTTSKISHKKALALLSERSQSSII